MNESDNRKTRAGRVAQRSFATIRVPAKNLRGEAQALQSIRARGQFHAACWHLEYVGSARSVEHVRPPEEAGECLAILAIADQAEATGWSNLARDAADVAASAPKRDV
jgi:hypothetical protein